MRWCRLVDSHPQQQTTLVRSNLLVVLCISYAPRKQNDKDGISWGFGMKGWNLEYFLIVTIVLVLSSSYIL